MGESRAAGTRSHPRLLSARRLTVGALLAVGRNVLDDGRRCGGGSGGARVSGGVSRRTGAPSAAALSVVSLLLSPGGLTLGELEGAPLHHGQLAKEQIAALVHLLEGLLVHADIFKLLRRRARGVGAQSEM